MKEDKTFKDIIESKGKIEKLEYEVTISDLVEAGIQFGHDPSYTHPGMKEHLFWKKRGAGERKGDCAIIDLDKTIEMLEKPCRFLEEEVSKGKSVLWIGTKTNSAPIVEEQAKRSGGYFVNHKWFGGLITNFKTVLETIRKKEDIERLCESYKDGQKIITKKEFSSKQNTLRRNKAIYRGIENIKTLPDIIILADRDEKNTIVKEANDRGICVIKICDTNSSPKGVQFVIPANDDSTKSLQFILNLLGNFCVSGVTLRTLKASQQPSKPPEKYVKNKLFIKPNR